MKPDDPIDWLDATEEQRKIVHAATKRVLRTTSMKWEQFFKTTLGRNTSPESMEDNFRHGKLARPHVAKIYRWIKEHHPAEAARIDTQLRQTIKAPLRDLIAHDLPDYEVNQRLASRGKHLDTPVTIRDALYLVTGRDRPLLPSDTREPPDIRAALKRLIKRSPDKK